MSTVCFDFDGVIHPYHKGFHSSLEHPANQDVVEAIRALHMKGWQVVVFTTRAATQNGKRQVENYLKEENLLGCVSLITDKKVPARVYVDDRAIQYNGPSTTLLRDILTFRSHTEGRV